MSEEQESEEILLVSTEDIGAIDFESLHNITQKIVQINPWRRKSVSTFVFDDRYAEIKRYEHGTTKHYWLNLLFLNQQPVHKRRINWRWAGATLLLVANAAVVYGLSFHTQLLNGFAYSTSLLVLLCTFTLLSLFALVYFSENQWHFIGRHSGVALLSLMHNKPSSKEFKIFLAQLSDNIRQTQSTLEFPEKDTLAAELAEHRRLHEEKIISNSDYDNAKRNILQSHS